MLLGFWETPLKDLGFRFLFCVKKLKLQCWLLPSSWVKWYFTNINLPSPEYSKIGVEDQNSKQWNSRSPQVLSFKSRLKCQLRREGLPDLPGYEDSYSALYFASWVVTIMIIISYVIMLMISPLIPELIKPALTSYLILQTALLCPYFQCPLTCSIFFFNFSAWFLPPNIILYNLLINHVYYLLFVFYN